MAALPVEGPSRVLRRSLVLALPILTASIAAGAARPAVPADTQAAHETCTLPVAWDVAPLHAADPATPAAQATRADDTTPLFRVLPRTGRTLHVSQLGPPDLPAPPTSAASALPDLTGARTGVPVFSHTAPPPAR